MPSITSTADLVAKLAPILQRTLADHRESILSGIHPLPMRMAAGPVLDGIGDAIPDLLTQVLGSLASEFRTVTVADVFASIN